jgi:DMSO reductase family type II enzyme molybdopterin subunit
VSTFTRREFLESAAAAGVVLSLPSFCSREGGPVERIAERPLPSYASFMDVYREQWTWDRVVRSSHFLNCWYQSHCAWDVYVKDGLVFREEQAGEYPQTRPDLPDFNPRGCQKGACFSERMYDATRVKYPLKRVGPRGSGRFERVSWDEALGAIADKWLDVVEKEETDRVVWDIGPGYSGGTPTAAHARFSELAGTVSLDMNAEIGDAHRGCLESFGKIDMERSADDYFHSDLILIWGCNPFYTQIPNAHFLTEARYNGSRIIAIAPDYNASSIHADLWIPVAPGGDAALALGVAHLLIAENKVARDFGVEQTDLPLLVREDTGRFLAEADLKRGGREHRPYVLDASGEVRLAPWKSLALGRLRPALEGRAEVTLHDGARVAVRPVFELLRERLAEYTPARAAELSGTPEPLIRRLAEEVASAKAAAHVTTSNFNKYYHGNLIERSMILVLALAGHMGRHGAGYSGFPMLVADGIGPFLAGLRMKDRAKMMAVVMPQMMGRRLRGDLEESVFIDFGRDMHKRGRQTSGVLFWNVHGGLLELSGRSQEWDPHLKRSVKEHVDEALAKGWQVLTPAPDKPPRILLSMYSNSLRRLRGSHVVREKLWKELDLIAVLDWRMGTTTRQADYVLPISTWYERTDLKWVTPLSPFLHTSEKATAAWGEARTDWWVIASLAKELQRRARERGISTVHDGKGVAYRMDTLFDEFSMDGRFGPEDDAEVTRALVEEASNVSAEWDELLAKGFTRFTGVGTASHSNMCDIEPGKTIAPLEHHVRDKVPYPTATRRIQFYLDHPLYEELDEVLPRHKEAPKVGGEFPLVLTGGHTRWSIHAAWRDSETMLRLHRGAPFLLLAAEDAAARGIADGDRVRVWNTVGEFEVRAKVAPQLRPGQTIIYHAWEDFQFRGGKSHNHLTPSPINPVELAGGHPHLTYAYNFATPGQFDRETRIDVERIAEEGAA